MPTRRASREVGDGRVGALGGRRRPLAVDAGARGNGGLRAIDAGEKEAGCTVHWVVPEVDGGEIIAQARVPVLPGDTAETLATRVLVEEHRIYPEALRNIALVT